MKSRRIPLESEVDKYEVGKGMEDGFELFSDVVTKGWIVTDSLVKIERRRRYDRVPVHQAPQRTYLYR